MKAITTFPRRDECEKAKARLDGLGLPYAVVSPLPGYGRLGLPICTGEHDHLKAAFLGIRSSLGLSAMEVGAVQE